MAKASVSDQVIEGEVRVDVVEDSVEFVEQSEEIRAILQSLKSQIIGSNFRSSSISGFSSKMSKFVDAVEMFVEMFPSAELDLNDNCLSFFFAADLIFFRGKNVRKFESITGRKINHEQAVESIRSEDKQVVDLNVTMLQELNQKNIKLIKALGVKNLHLSSIEDVARFASSFQGAPQEFNLIIDSTEPIIIDRLVQNDNMRNIAYLSQYSRSVEGVNVVFKLNDAGDLSDLENLIDQFPIRFKLVLTDNFLRAEGLETFQEAISEYKALEIELEPEGYSYIMSQFVASCWEEQKPSEIFHHIFDTEKGREYFTFKFIENVIEKNNFELLQKLMKYAPDYLSYINPETTLKLTDQLFDQVGFRQFDLIVQSFQGIDVILESKGYRYMIDKFLNQISNDIKPDAIFQKLFHVTECKELLSSIFEKLYQSDRLADHQLLVKLFENAGKYFDTPLPGILAEKGILHLVHRGGEYSVAELQIMNYAGQLFTQVAGAVQNTEMFHRLLDKASSSNAKTKELAGSVLLNLNWAELIPGIHYYSNFLSNFVDSIFTKNLGVKVLLKNSILLEKNPGIMKSISPLDIINMYSRSEIDAEELNTYFQIRSNYKGKLSKVDGCVIQSLNTDVIPQEILQREGIVKIDPVVKKALESFVTLSDDALKFSTEFGIALQKVIDRDSSGLVKLVLSMQPYIVANEGNMALNFIDRIDVYSGSGAFSVAQHVGGFAGGGQTMIKYYDGYTHNTVEVIIHELTHACMKRLFKNSAEPYFEDSIAEGSYMKIITKLQQHDFMKQGAPFVTEGGIYKPGDYPAEVIAYFMGNLALQLSQGKPIGQGPILHETSFLNSSDLWIWSLKHIKPVLQKFVDNPYMKTKDVRALSDALDGQYEGEFAEMRLLGISEDHAEVLSGMTLIV